MLTKDQVNRWNLPTRNPKGADTKNGYDFCCELDAVPPNIMREHIESLILRHIPTEILERLRRIENEERETIRNVFSYLDGNVGTF